MRPRHGFVDSRKIENTEDGQTLIRQTLEADPEAEIVTMPLIDAEYSGIWTLGILTVGHGHDSATSGKSSWSLPALGTLVPPQTLEDAGVEGTPYVELLWPHGDNLYRLVQLRDGPSLPQTVNFIPCAVRVERIVNAWGDLLDWEKEMQTATPGTVVYHPHASLASHYAIHAILNQVPVLVDREPRIGEVLEREGPISTMTPDIAALRAGFALALRIRATYEDAAHAMLAGCHHVSVWAGKHDDLLGIALGFAYRLTVAASLGSSVFCSQKGDVMSTSANDSSLFELDHELDLLIDEIHKQAAEGGEVNVSPDLISRFEAFCCTFSRKVDRIGHFLMNLEARAAHCRDEASRLSERARLAESKAARTKQMVLYFLASQGIQKVEGLETSLRRQKNSQDSVIIHNDALVPMEYREIEAKIPGRFWRQLQALISDDDKREMNTCIRHSIPSIAAIKSAKLMNADVPGTEIRRNYHLRVE